MRGCVYDSVHHNEFGVLYRRDKIPFAITLYRCSFLEQLTNHILHNTIFYLCYLCGDIVYTHWYSQDWENGFVSNLPDDGKRKKPSFSSPFPMPDYITAAFTKSRPPFFMPSYWRRPDAGGIGGLRREPPWRKKRFDIMRQSAGCQKSRLLFTVALRLSYWTVMPWFTRTKKKRACRLG